MSIFTVPTIETERLILRPMTVDDAEDMFGWAGDERVAKYMMYTTHESPDVARQWLSTADRIENGYLWGFVRKNDGKLIGSGAIRFRTDEQRWSLAYSIRFDCWNQGYTTEATLRMMDYVREKHDAMRFVAEHAVDNPASGRVMEKCGLHYVKDCEYTKFDGTVIKAKEYELNE